MVFNIRNFNNKDSHDAFAALITFHRPRFVIRISNTSWTCWKAIAGARSKWSGRSAYNSFSNRLLCCLCWLICKRRTIASCSPTKLCTSYDSSACIGAREKFHAPSRHYKHLSTSIAAPVHQSNLI